MLSYTLYAKPTRETDELRQKCFTVWNRCWNSETIPKKKTTRKSKPKETTQKHIVTGNRNETRFAFKCEYGSFPFFWMNFISFLIKFIMFFSAVIFSCTKKKKKKTLFLYSICTWNWLVLFSWIKRHLFPFVHLISPIHLDSVSVYRININIIHIKFGEALILP